MREYVTSLEYEVVRVSPAGVVRTRPLGEDGDGPWLYWTPSDFEESDRALLVPGAVIRRELVHRIEVLPPKGG